MGEQEAGDVAMPVLQDADARQPNKLTGANAAIARWLAIVSLHAPLASAWSFGVLYRASIFLPCS
jgi:membrane associated rhomboid family serine protease